LLNIQFAMPLGGMKFGIQACDMAYPQGSYAYSKWQKLFDS